MTINKVQLKEYFDSNEVIYDVYVKNNHLVFMLNENVILGKMFKIELLYDIHLIHQPHILECKVWSFFKNETDKGIQINDSELEVKGRNLYFKDEQLKGIDNIALHYERENIPYVTFTAKCRLLFYNPQ